MNHQTHMKLLNLVTAVKLGMITMSQFLELSSEVLKAQQVTIRKVELKAS